MGTKEQLLNTCTVKYCIHLISHENKIGLHLKVHSGTQSSLKLDLLTFMSN